MVVVTRYSTILTDRGSSVETTRNSDLHLVKKEAGEGRGEESRGGEERAREGRGGQGRAGQGRGIGNACTTLPSQRDVSRTYHHFRKELLPVQYLSLLS